MSSWSCAMVATFTLNTRFFFDTLTPLLVSLKFIYLLNTTFCKWAPLETVHSQKQWQTPFTTPSNSCLDIPSITALISVFRFIKSFAGLSSTLIFTYSHKRKLQRVILSSWVATLESSDWRLHVDKISLSGSSKPHSCHMKLPYLVEIFLLYYNVLSI